MNRREVSLYLKYPASSRALQRLQYSFMECVVEHKSGTLEELYSTPPNQLRSDYQLKATASLDDDEIVVKFVPKHLGLHMARIFANTRELCKPVAFTVDKNLELENIPSDRTISVTSSFFRQLTASPAPSFSQSLPAQQRMDRNMAMNFSGTINDRMLMGISEGGNVMTVTDHQQRQQQNFQLQQQQQQQQQGQQQGDPLARNFMSNPSLSQQYQDYPSSPRENTSLGNSGNLRYSYISGQAGGSRPSSMAFDNVAYPGDLHTMTPDRSTFNDLYSRRKSGDTKSSTVKKDMLVMDYSQPVTPETFQMLDNDIKKYVGRGGIKQKRKCEICSKKTKLSKLMEIGEHDFCEQCFKRQYVLRSAVDHFMVPSVRECSVDVPINKKATRYITTKMTIADVNLRGLDPNEVRFAQDEIKRFEMDDSGWISKAVLFPLLRACFSARLNAHETRHLLTSPALKDLMTSYGLDDRDEVHELEFLGLLAFLAREAIGLRGISSTKAGKKFGPGDLEMAYAFHNQQNKHGGLRAHPSPPRPPPEDLMGVGSRQVSPQHRYPPPPSSPYRQNTPHYQLPSTSPKHHSAMFDSNGGGMGGLQDSLQDGLQQSPQRRQHHQEGRGFGVDLQREAVEWQENHSPRRMPEDRAPSQSPPRTGLVPPARGQSMLSESGHYQQQLDEEHPVRQSALLRPGPTALGDTRYSMGPMQRDDRPVSMLEPSVGGQQYLGGRMTESVRGRGPPMGGRQALEDGKLSAFSGLREIPTYEENASQMTRQDLPEDDQEELPELPSIPPGKDPERQTVTFNKKNTSSKKIMHDLKLTGDVADSWMLY